MDLNLRMIRRQLITALASDDVLFDVLALKGGNALDLLHNIGGRASLDLDYSLEGDLENPEAAGERMFSALRARMFDLGLTLFDESFGMRPRSGGEDRWGGYLAEFKLIPTSRFEELGGDPSFVRRESLSISGHPQGKRVFRIEISKFEYCVGVEEIEVEDGFVCRVYSCELLAAEKLRSLCQQMEEYPKRKAFRRRSRDFYDLYGLFTEGQIDLSAGDVQDTVRSVFDAKEVPLWLISLLPQYCSFHEEDWDSARDEIPPQRSQDFGFYAAYLLEEVRKLEPLWMEDPPL